MAIAPTASIGLVAGTTPGFDPQFPLAPVDVVVDPTKLANPAEATSLQVTVVPNDAENTAVSCPLK